MTSLSMIFESVTQDTVLPLAFPVELKPTHGGEGVIHSTFTLVKNTATALWKCVLPSQDQKKRNSSSKEAETTTAGSSITGAQTQTTMQLPLRAGTQVTLALGAANRDPAIWGADAASWRPARWLKSQSLGAGLNGCVGTNGCKARRKSGVRPRTTAVNGDQHGVKVKDGIENESEESEDGWSTHTSASPINEENGNQYSGDEEAWRVPGVYSGM